MKILFLEPYPTEGPSSRYRVEQYIPYLRNNGLECIVRPFISPKFYRILYKKGYYFQKILYFLQGSIRRSFDLFTAVNSDIVFIHLEAFPIGPPLFEWILAKLGKKIIYDLDDAIYMRAASPSNKFLKYLKWPSKIKNIIKISNYVITCNEYLADYAKKYNKNVTVIHTSVDTEKFVPKNKTNEEKITIGWIGSYTTSKYLAELRNVLYRLRLKYDFNFKTIGASEYNPKISHLNIINIPWRLQDEVEQFQSFDIGVYPLPENKWILGKTGFKTIQYMSIGIPCVVASVGANKDIVKDGINGFLAGTEEEWVVKISRLIEDMDLRRKIGACGRKTVEEKFSVKVNAPKYLGIIKNIHKQHTDRAEK